MSEIKWDDQVQVQILEPIGIENYQVVEERVFKWDEIDLKWDEIDLKWDEIDLAEAVKRCMTLSPEEREKVSISAPSGSYGTREIEALFHRLP
jgi:hypothetical protein